MVAGKGVRAYGHFINVLTAEKLAVISLHSVLSLLCKVRFSAPAPSSAGRLTMLRTPQGGSDHSPFNSEGVVLTSKVVNHIADGVQAQVNLAKLDMHMRQMKKKALPAMKVLGIQAANLLAARSDVRDAKWDPALKAKVRRRCASPLCHSPVPTDGLSADWGAPHALGHRVRHHEGPQQGVRSSRWCLSRAQLLTDTSLLRLLDEGRTGAG